MSGPSLTRAERIEALVVHLRSLCALDEANTVEREFAEMKAEWDEAVAEADRLNVITGEQGERIACLERTLAAARVEGVRLGLEAAAVECERIAAQHPGDGGPPETPMATAVAQIIANAGCEACALAVRALDPAAVANGGTRE